MPAKYRDISKLCENCGTQLTLNCTRDITRKKFCSRSCNRSFTTKRLWETAEYRKMILASANTVEANLKKGHKKENHPMWGKPNSIETKLKRSISLSNSILAGKFNPHSNHLNGYIFHKKFTKEIFYRSSYEKIFLEKIILDDSIIKVTSSPFKIKYNECKHYIPDFLIEKTDGTKILIEVKPSSQINTYVNQLKFDAAIEFCNQLNIEFKVFTEKDF